MASSSSCRASSRSGTTCRLSNLTWAVIIPPLGGLVGQLLVGWSSDRTGERRLHGSVPIYLGAIALGCTLLIPASLSFNCAWPGRCAVHHGAHGAEVVHAGVLGIAQPAPDRGRRRGKHRPDQLGGQSRWIRRPVCAWLRRKADSLLLARSSVPLPLDDHLGHDHPYPRPWHRTPVANQDVSQKAYSTKSPMPSSNPPEMSRSPLTKPTSGSATYDSRNSRSSRVRFWMTPRLSAFRMASARSRFFCWSSRIFSSTVSRQIRR